MPIYEYRCSECGKEFEMMQKITDDPLSTCKFCQGSVQKLISNSSFHLKGTGWYVTDYARKSGNNSSDSSADTAKEAEKTAPSDKATSSNKTASESKESGSTSGETKSSSTAKQASNA